MPKAVMLVFSAPSSAERDGEYNTWYDETHLRELCAVPGIVAARRFRRSEVQSASRPPQQALPAYVAIYELDTDDIAASLDELKARGDNGTNAKPAPGLMEVDATYEVGVYELWSSFPTE
jgi:hypothetical protein